MKNRLSFLLLFICCFAPLFWRLSGHGCSQAIGLMSDGLCGLLVFLVALALPHWLRMAWVLLWAMFQIGAWELFGAMQRFPSWEDLHYLADPSFVEKSASGLHLSYPWLAGILLASFVLSWFFPVKRPGKKFWLGGFLIGICLLLFHGYLALRHDDQSVAARYNPLHKFISDLVYSLLEPPPLALSEADLPAQFRQTDLSGKPLLTGRGAAKNVLIVVLEGIPGLYYPEIREAMGVPPYDGVEMKHLAETTPDAMLIPDFVTHSHQTIRGLYAILSGDISKLSYDMPKAFELLQNPERAADCLPAQMAKHGWSTHYLQAANLMFMGKDRVMPAMGFQHVHGIEWFKEKNPYEFPWGVIDPVFFRGARQYIHDLQAEGKPWMLTLLTVGTHQPYAAPDEIAKKYASRKMATVAILDEAVGEFIKGLRQDGVFEDTLVILTCDESHGSDMGDWMTSWGLGAVLAPEHGRLPRIKEGTFGLMDITVSILDYLNLTIPKSLIGRSFFRDYTQPREIAAYTSSRLRWHTAGGLRYQCSMDRTCRVGKAASILGDPPKDMKAASRKEGARLWALASVLDHKLTSKQKVQVMKFASGEIRKLPEKLLVESEWSENLAGAQYLNFPANSKVSVSIRVKAVQAPTEGIQLKLFLREWEHRVGGIRVPEFPVLHTGEEGGIKFDFENKTARQSFSFHLIGEGKNALVQMLEFTVTVDRQGKK